MKKTLPKQSATVCENLVTFRPSNVVTTEWVNGKNYVTLQGEGCVIRAMVEPCLTRRTRAKMRKHPSEPETVFKSLNTYLVFKDATCTDRLNRLFDNYTRKQFPLTRAERKKAAIALVRYSKNNFVYLTIKQAISLVCLYETMLDGVNYFVNVGVERGYCAHPHRYTEKYFTDNMFKQPLWVYSTVRAIFNMLDFIHEDGFSLQEQIEEIQDKLNKPIPWQELPTRLQAIREMSMKHLDPNYTVKRS